MIREGLGGKSRNIVAIGLAGPAPPLYGLAYVIVARYFGRSYGIY
jgi:hypothetical protein